MSKRHRVECPTCDGTGYIYIDAIQARREQLGMKQEEVADILNVTRSQYSNIERGKTNVTSDKIRPLAKLLKISVEDLLEILYGKEGV